MHGFARLLFAASALGLALSAAAQYTLDSYTVDGGGGTSSGGAYVLSGTIGQPDADVAPACSTDGGAACIGARYQLDGGFWDALAPAACTGALNCIFRDGFEPAPA